MNYNNVSLPYPVLGINDDIFPLLEDDCIEMEEPVKTPTDYQFFFTLKLKNTDIANLLSSGKAEYICEVSCKNTYLRRCFHSQYPNFKIVLSRREVNGRINFNCFVVAKEAIPQYNNSLFNEDYQGFSFDLNIGDMLVVFPQAFYNTNIKFDKLFAAGSFMQIVEAEKGVDKTWFNLDSDRILIELPHELFEQYQRIGNAFPEVIHSSLVHNALVYALANLPDYIERGKLWSDSLIQRLQEEEFRQINIDDFQNDMNQVYKVADALLQDPYKRLFDSLEKFSDKKEELED